MLVGNNIKLMYEPLIDVIQGYVNFGDPFECRYELYDGVPQGDQDCSVLTGFTCLEICNICMVGFQRNPKVD